MEMKKKYFIQHFGDFFIAELLQSALFVNFAWINMDALHREPLMMKG